MDPTLPAPTATTSSDLEESGNHSIDSDTAESGDSYINGSSGSSSGSSSSSNTESGDRDHPISFIRAGLTCARSEVRKLLLFAVLKIKISTPRYTSDVAWNSLVARLRRENIFENDQEVIVAWRFAFREPAHAHFRAIFEGSASDLYEAWREADESQ